MEPFASVVARTETLFDAHRDGARTNAMAAYMRHQFPFAGIPTPQRRALQREALRGLAPPTEEQLLQVAWELWGRGEREYQYAAADLVTKFTARCGPTALATIRRLITTKSWWDTVDALAAHGVGPLVMAHPILAGEMDTWVDHEDLWLRRTAILHQLHFKSATDTARLFDYCLRRAHEREFFIRKAIGWALREYSKTDATAVTRFVAEHEGELSPLSRREALV
jgi:3-methyladenine DNA glycosylase AlkD